MPNFIVKNVTYAYPNFARSAVKNVSFSIAEGEYVAILGANGSGKSTLARLLTGFLEPDSGSITVKGSLKSQTNSVLSSIVFQSPRDQIVAETLERDTAFGPENINCSVGETQKRVQECLSLIDLLDRKTDKTAFLSLGQKQKLALAGILALSPDLLVLDEAVSMVDPDMRMAILEYLDAWHTEKRTIIHITHDIDEALRAKHIIAIDNGTLIFDGTHDSFCATTSLAQRLFGQAPVSLRNSSTNVGFSEPGLVFHNVNFEYKKTKKTDTSKFDCLVDSFYGGVSSISLAFEKGKVTALMGASGSGKSTILELAAGLLTPDSGSILATCKPLLALQETESALFEEFVADDVAFGPKNQGLKGKKLKECVKNAMDMCAVPFFKYGERHSFALSGGEKRKIALAGIIAMQGQVYLFDEPTAGLDPLSRHTVMNMLAKLAQQGKTVVFSTHRKEEGDFAHRCIRLSNGKVCADTNSKANAAASHSLQPVNTGDLSMLEGLKNTSTGVYRKKKSLLHTRKPVTKFLVFLSIFIAGIAMQPLYLLCGMALLSVFYAVLGKYPLKKLAITFFKFLPWIMLFAVFQFLLFSTQPGEKIYWQYAFISISPSKVKIVIKTMLHVIAALSSIATFLYSTEETELLDGLKTLCSPLQKIGIKSKYIAMTVSLVFRFIPLLADEAAQIIKVQIIRGSFKPTKGVLHRVKSMLPLFVPLILQTFKRAEALGETLDARYF